MVRVLEHAHENEGNTFKQCIRQIEDGAWWTSALAYRTVWKLESIEPRALMTKGDVCHVSIRSSVASILESVFWNLSDRLERHFLALEDDVGLLKRASVGASSSTENVPSSKLKVPESKPFMGSQNAKDME
ncbi:hypothetical protein PanWU01x14_065620, partial [Parasponia andersonii]